MAADIRKTDEIEFAFERAKKILKLNFNKDGVFAGKTHFNDFWARDFCFASLGVTAMGDCDIVKKNIENYLRFQKPNGLLPFLIGTKHFLLKYLGFPVKDKVPIYNDLKVKSTVIDQNSLVVMAALNCIKESQDTEFTRNNFEKLKKAVEWSLSADMDKDWLIEEKFFANWADSVKKSGQVLYSNVCFYKAVVDFTKICEICNEKVLAIKYEELSKKIKNAINKKFWNGEYYIDWIEGKNRYDFFSTDGNLLAIIWNIADEEKIQKILSCVKKFKLDVSVPCRTNYPRYPVSFISWLNRFICLSDYHNSGLSWLWLGCCLAIALEKAGKREEAVGTIEKIAKVINKYDTIYEVYERNGQPVNRILYKSEKDFTWSAGLFVYTVKEVYLNSTKPKTVH